MELVYIYSLIDPRDNQIKYIGKANNINSRLYTHTANCNLIKNTPKIQWIRFLKDKGLKPIIEEIDRVLITEWQFWEKHYISLYKSWGFNLKNLTIGGDGNTCLTRTEEFKKKISLKLKGRKTYIRTEESKLKLSNSQKETYKNGRKSNITLEIAANAREIWKKKIIQLDLNNNVLAEFNSIKEASTKLNVSSGNISSACKNGNKAYNYYWKYKI